MPAAHSEAETVEASFALDPQLLADYMTWPRSARRAICRDVARERPVSPKPPRYRAVGRTVKPAHPMVHRVLMGADAQLAQAWRAPASNRIVSPRSGQARINTKRNARAEFWRTVKVHVHPDVEQPFREHLNLLGPGARIHGRRVPDFAYVVELDVHIPGAPADAVKAEPIYGSGWNGRAYEPFLMQIDWFDADGQRMQFPDVAFTSR